ncbi:hypothetical protein PGB90_006720 [Kerria lacca]
MKGKRETTVVAYFWNCCHEEKRSRNGPETWVLLQWSRVAKNNPARTKYRNDDCLKSFGYDTIKKKKNK